MNMIRLAAEGMAMDGSAYMQTVMGILPLVLMVALLYFFMIRPQKKRDKEEREMRNSIQVGDEISTIGGFIGKVVSIKDDVLTIETSQRPHQAAHLPLGDPRQGGRTCREGGSPEGLTRRREQVLGRLFAE